MVFGHLIEVYKDSVHDLYLIIYSVHMPLFILISGYFAKKANAKKVINFVLLFFVYETIYDSFFSLGFRELRFGYIVPYFHLWYLVSMAFWYLLAIPLTKTKVNKIIVILITLIISLFSRFIVIDGFDEYALSFQRTLSFMFFFIVGFFLDRTAMLKIRTLINKKVLVTILSLLGFIAYIQFTNKENMELVFRGPFNIEQVNASSIEFFIQIFMCYLISSYMCFLLLNVVSEKKSFLTTWGDNSLYIFLFHAFFVIPFQLIPGVLSELNQWLIVLIMITIAIVASFVLSSKIFVRITADLCNPYNTLRKIIKRNKITTFSQ